MWTAAKPATGSLGDLWIAYNPEVKYTYVNGKVYAGLSADARDYTNVAGEVFDAFKPKKGDEIVPCKYANAWNYTDNATWVKKESDSNWEAIDTKGESLFKIKEDEKPEIGFHNGLALVSRSEWDKENYTYIKTYRYVDKTGETVYKWTPGEDDEDKAPKSWEELDRENIMRTEAGAIVREIEEMNALMAR